MKLYEVGFLNDSIKEVESEKQTEKSVFINGNRNQWFSRFSKYFKTKDDAKEFCINSCLMKIENLEYRLKKMREDLIKIKSL